jgi:hypothetical protein
VSLPGVVQEYTVRTMDDSHEDDEDDEEDEHDDGDDNEAGDRDCIPIVSVVFQ